MHKPVLLTLSRLLFSLPNEGPFSPRHNRTEKEKENRGSEIVLVVSQCLINNRELSALKLLTDIVIVAIVCCNYSRFASSFSFFLSFSSRVFEEGFLLSLPPLV